MKYFAISLVVLTLAIGLSCSDQKTSESPRKQGADATPSVTTPPPSTPAANANGAGAVISKPGLPEKCKLQADTVNVCLICTPRDLPLQKCVMGPMFDGASLCQNTETQVSCKLPDGTLLALGLGESSEEKFLANLPLLVVAGKLLASQKLKPNSVESAMVNASLDFVSANARAILVGADNTAIANSLVASLLKANPALSAANQTKIKAGTVAALTAFTEIRKNGQLDVLGTVQLASKIIQALPPEITSQVLANFKPEELVPMLDQVKAATSASPGITTGTGTTPSGSGASTAMPSKPNLSGGGGYPPPPQIDNSILNAPKVLGFDQPKSKN